MFLQCKIAMNIKTTIVLLLLLMGVGAYVFFTRDKGDQPVTKHEEHTLLDLKTDQIARFDITASDGKEIAAEKTKGADGQDVWQLTKPVKAIAETYKVNSLLETLTGLKSTEQVSGTGTSLEGAGLDKPKYTLDLGQSPNEVRVEVGDPLPVGDGVYVRVKGHDMIDVVSSSIMDTLKQPANSLRKDHLFETAPPSVRQLTITHKDGSQLVMEKNALGWRIIKPVAMPADGSAVEDLASSVINMQPVDFVDDPSEVLGMGLNKPELTVAFSTAAPSTQPATMPAVIDKAEKVIFGNYEDVNKKNVFAQTSNGTIVKVPASVLDSLQKKPLDLRDKTVVDIDPALVAKLVIASNQPATTQPVAPALDKIATLTRRPKAPIGPPAPKPVTTGPTTGPSTLPVIPEAPKSEWVLAEPKPTDADDSRVTTLLGQLHPLKAEKYLEKPPAGKAVKTYTITVVTDASAPPTVITLVDPGNDANLIGSYNGLAFEVQRSIATDLSGDFAKPAAVK